MTTIHPGEYYATKDDVIICTVLGSCIAVALYDGKTRCGGLNHFMLPGTVAHGGYYTSASGKYGLFAMEFLVNAMLKLGSRKEDLTAKVFGGGSVIRTSAGFSGRIPESNIEFAFDYLETERIPVVSSDVGGVQARKVLFFPTTSKVLLKRISGKLITAVETEETRYYDSIKKELRRRKRPKDEEPTIF